MNKITLRPYQEEARAKLEQMRAAGESRALIHLATGLGKTALAATDALTYQAELAVEILPEGAVLARDIAAEFGLASTDHLMRFVRRTCNFEPFMYRRSSYYSAEHARELRKVRTEYEARKKPPLSIEAAVWAYEEAGRNGKRAAELVGYSDRALYKRLRQAGVVVSAK